MLKSKVRLSDNKQMDDYKSLSFIVGRISKGLRLSKVMVPAQKLENMIFQLMSMAPKSRPKRDGGGGKKYQVKSAK